MTEEEILHVTPSAYTVTDHFGYWPSFHDAEVLSVELRRDGPSLLRIHTFATLSDLTSSGHYKTNKHAVVSFVFEDVQDMQLQGFNHQNVISSLLLQKSANGIEFVLCGCYGLEGRIIAKQLAIELRPGMPTGSIYSTTSS